LSEKVSVYYDEIGVPHIEAENENDAFQALGYVHAQDRLWQMELIRRIAAGRLSEIFGKDLVRVDAFFSGLGIEEEAQKTIDELDKKTPSYILAQAYLDGINQYIEKGATPIEFYMLGIEKEKYTLKDIYNVFGYMAFSFATAHKIDPMLTEIKEKLGDDYVRELLEATYVGDTRIKSEKKPILKADVAKAIKGIINQLPVSPFIGSNAWVIGAEKTKNGKVIFANDPHIGFSQPSVWYQSHIKTPTYEMYGFNLALTPFPLLGHNKKYAYGLTMFKNDDIDFYYEQNNPENPLEYKTPNGYEKYIIQEKKIQIKGEKDSIYQVKISKHGPVINNLIEFVTNDKPMAMQWLYTKDKNELLDVGYDLSHATSLRKFQQAAEKLHAPGLNIMYGDADDNIAWFAAGKLYKYRDSLERKLVLDGASGKDEIKEYIEFEQNPQAVNPSWNYVYSANNQTDSVAGMLYPGYYSSEDRGRRIVELLEEKNDFTKQDVAEMICDVTSVLAPEISAFWVQDVQTSMLSPTEKKALDILKKWKGSFEKEEIAPVIYNRLWYEFVKNTFQDEMGEAFEQFVNTSLERKAVQNQVSKKESLWWDNINTKDKKETKKEIITKSFKQAISFLQKQLGENVEHWKWERVISVEHEHAIGKAGGILRDIFNVGVFQTKGGNQVLNNKKYKIDSTGYYKVTAGPSTRRVIDFSDVENSLAVIPTGQSGNVLSPYYKNQAEKYEKGEFYTMKINKEEVEKTDNKLFLIPEK
jgi:penicillin amidase